MELPIQSDGTPSTCFVCLVCSVYLECDVTMDRNEERRNFTKLHMATCSKQFGEIERFVRPGGDEIKPKIKCCDKCGYDAEGNQYNLKRHITICKGAKKPADFSKNLKCQYCDYVTYSNYNIKRHGALCKSKPDTPQPVNTIILVTPQENEALSTLLEVKEEPSPVLEIQDLKGEITRLKAQLEEAQLHKPSEDDSIEYTDTFDISSIRNRKQKLKMLEYKTENQRLKEELEAERKAKALLPERTKEIIICAFNTADDTLSDSDLIEKAVREYQRIKIKYDKLNKHFDLLDEEHTKLNEKYEQILDMQRLLKDALRNLIVCDDFLDILKERCTVDQVRAIKSLVFDD